LSTLPVDAGTNLHDDACPVSGDHAIDSAVGNTVVPEPGTLLLMVLGTPLLLMSWRSRLDSRVDAKSSEALESVSCRLVARQVLQRTIMNCWEFKVCGREEGGAKAHELGVCPAYTRGAGEACWFIAGTLCGGTVQGTYAQKIATCVVCDFFELFDLEHRYAMWKKFH
jgi:hypothetical protein